MLTYTEQLRLVEQKYAKVSINGNLSTFKYHPRVFYKKLWNTIPGILECRGHTYDNTTGELVLAAPTKTFNYRENGHWLNISLDTPVVLYKKYNGFMATITKYRGDIVIGTTGSTKSDFVHLAKQVLFDKYTEEKLHDKFDHYQDRVTFLYEICDPSDPHIVYETPDAEILGRRVHGGSWTFEPVCFDAFSTTLEHALELAKSERDIEGWIVYNQYTGDVCKLKTDYYVSKKKLMRMRESDVAQMFAKPTDTLAKLPLTWAPVVEQIVARHTPEDWISLSDQQRRKFIETVF